MSRFYHAFGQLRHRYWGDYSAFIVLQFDNELYARKALPALTMEMNDSFSSAVGGRCEPTGWLQGEEYPSTLAVEAGGKDVDKIIKRLSAYGADKDKITSHNFSPDYGEEFEVFVPHVYVDHPKQILMPFVTK